MESPGRAVLKADLTELLFSIAGGLPTHIIVHNARALAARMQAYHSAPEPFDLRDICHTILGTKEKEEDWEDDGTVPDWERKVLD